MACRTADLFWLISMLRQPRQPGTRKDADQPFSHSLCATGSSLVELVFEADKLRKNKKDAMERHKQIESEFNA